jgi:hypothetical protein
MIRALALLALWPGVLSAQSLQEALATAPEISFTAWQNMTAGKTVVYEIDGQTYGYEHYSPTTNNVQIRLDDGTCIDGTWYMDNSAFCFDWQDGPLNCFHHKRLGDTVYVIGLDNGVETSDIQKVSRIAAIPLACGPALLSAYHPETTQ